jgi:hypothetical protein
MDLAKELNQDFNEAVKKSPLYEWMQPEGDALGLGDIPQQQFMEGIVVMLGAMHENILRLAREIDASR